MPVALLAGLLLQTVVTVTVAGRVVSSTTGAPIRKAAVTLQADAVERVAITDAEGRFRFPDLPPGKYGAKAERAGFLADESEHEIEVHENPAELELKLVPQAVLAGHMLDEDGEPMPGASVTYRRYHRSKHGHAIQSGGSDANADGYFVIAGLEPGNYLLSAGPPDRTSTGVHETYFETYYPSAVDKEGATLFEPSAGTEIRDLEVRLRRSLAYRVRGLLVFAGGDKTGRPSLMLVPDPMSAHPGPPDPSRCTLNLQEGTFECRGVRPGDYVLTPGQFYSRDDSTGDYRLAARSCYYPITVASDVDDLVVNLGPGVDISGKQWEAAVTKIDVAKGAHLNVELTPIDADPRE